MKPFAYVTPKSIEEAVAQLAEHSPDAMPIAGGTDLLVRLKRNEVAPKVLVDLAGIRGLYGIELTEQGLRIGAMVTHAQVAASPLVQEHVPAVAEASATDSDSRKAKILSKELEEPRLMGPFTLRTLVRAQEP